MTRALCTFFNQRIDPFPERPRFLIRRRLQWCMNAREAQLQETCFNMHDKAPTLRMHNRHISGLDIVLLAVDRPPRHGPRNGNHHTKGSL